MQTSLRLELADARQLIAAAQAEAEQRSARVTIAICDSGGLLLVLERRDGASCSSAETAAAKARTGGEIANLTYRSAYTEDPKDQLAGYTDSKPERAWGFFDWSTRAGQGAQIGRASCRERV